MSNSETPARARLSVKAADKGTELYVIDGRLRLACKGLGQLDKELPPGIYKVKARSALSEEEQFVDLSRPTVDPIVVQFGPLRFASPVPLQDTAKTREYQIAAAQDHSREVHVRLGTGSELFVFARDWGVPMENQAARTNPAKCLWLCGANGEVLLDLSSHRFPQDLIRDPWTACNAKVSPGAYRLRVYLPNGAQQERMIYCSPGWQSQVFLMQRDFGDRAAPSGDQFPSRIQEVSRGRLPDLAAASVLMSRVGEGFCASSSKMRLVELARNGLVSGRMVLAQDTVNQILDGKSEDPMLGLQGAHLWLMTKSSNELSLNSVVRNLRMLLGDNHSDVEALATQIPGARPFRPVPWPPMLRRSWDLLVRASIDSPDLIPASSLAARIADRIWEAPPWLSWRCPPPGQVGLDAGYRLAIQTRATSNRKCRKTSRKIAAPMDQSSMSLIGPGDSQQEGSASDPSLSDLVTRTGLPLSRVVELMEHGGGSKRRDANMDIARVVVSSRSASRPMRPAAEPSMAMSDLSMVAASPNSLSRINGFARIIAEKEVVPGVLVAVDDPGASLWQSFLAEKAIDEKRTDSAPAGALEATFDDHDPGWILSFLNWWQGIVKFKWLSPPETPTPIPDRFRMAVLGDWGTGLYGAPACAKSIEKDGKYEFLLHLGDVYYSGTESEIRSRFLDLWPKIPGATSLALNSNHEMYTGGHAYKHQTLKAFGQGSSCFALMNSNWLMVGLDTAYHEHELDQAQVDWLRKMIAAAGGRKVALFSHHQPFSLIEQQGPKVVEPLRQLLDGKAIAAWYWGHEHRCVIYDRHPSWDISGRCIGHSGFPYRRIVPAGAKQESEGVGGVKWYQLPATDSVPGGVLLDGPNEFLEDQSALFGPNGYLSLEFDGSHLTETHCAPSGGTIRENEPA